MAASRWLPGLAAMLMATAAAGQEAPVPPPGPDPATAPPAQVRSPVLVIRRDVLFEGSAYGRAARARFEAASQALLAENRELERALEAEERELTGRRATLPADEFQALAAAFDTKVEGIRTAREAKSRDITRQFDEDRQRFLQIAGPVLAQIMAEYGAVVILDQQTVVVNLEAIDVTALATERLNAAPGDGTGATPRPGDPPPSPQP
jgi:Skp family chaperone for outer membrane proteins